MRRICTVLTAISIALSGLVFSPANASDGTYNCSTRGSFRIVGGVVSSGASCEGAAEIPAGVTSIGNSAFEFATALTSVTFAAGSLPTYIGDSAFHRTALTSITIPASVTSIYSSAFLSATSLNSITIPAGVNSIAENAFRYATALATFDFLGNAPATTSSAFYGVNASSTIYVNWDATGFTLDGSGKWYGLTVVRRQPPATAIDAPAQAAAQTLPTDLASRTISAKKSFAVESLAKRVGIEVVSKKAKVSIKVAKSSKKVCTLSGTKLKPLKAGNCVVTFTVQEPRSKKGKLPNATKTVVQLVLQ